MDKEALVVCSKTGRSFAMMVSTIGDLSRSCQRARLSLCLQSPPGAPSGSESADHQAGQKEKEKKTEQKQKLNLQEEAAKNTRSEKKGQFGHRRRKADFEREAAMNQPWELEFFARACRGSERIAPSTERETGRESAVDPTSNAAAGGTDGLEVGGSSAAQEHCSSCHPAI